MVNFLWRCMIWYRTTLDMPARCTPTLFSAVEASAWFKHFRYLIQRCSELKALLRRVMSPVVDIRDPIQLLHDRIAARAAELESHPVG